VAVSSSPRLRADTRGLSPRVPWRTRWRLARAARIDRRAGLPLGLDAGTTPVLAEIVARFHHAAEGERTSYLADEHDLTVELHRLESRRSSLSEELQRRAERLAHLTHGTDRSWLDVRYAGEESLSPAATRTRRAVSHRRALESAEAARSQAQGEMDDLLVEIADLRARMERRAEGARSSVLRHRERAQGEAAVYRRFLVRRHPERSALIDRWTTDICVLPAWAESIAPLPSESSSRPENEVSA
jgi:hypothetical protein